MHNNNVANYSLCGDLTVKLYKIISPDLLIKLFAKLNEALNFQPEMQNFK